MYSVQESGTIHPLICLCRHHKVDSLKRWQNLFRFPDAPRHRWELVTSYPHHILRDIDGNDLCCYREQWHEGLQCDACACPCVRYRSAPRHSLHRPFEQLLWVAGP